MPGAIITMLNRSIEIFCFPLLILYLVAISYAIYSINQSINQSISLSIDQKY